MTRRDEETAARENAKPIGNVDVLADRGEHWICPECGDVRKPGNDCRCAPIPSMKDNPNAWKDSSGRWHVMTVDNEAPKGREERDEKMAMADPAIKTAAKVLEHVEGMPDPERAMGFLVDEAMAAIIALAYYSNDDPATTLDYLRQSIPREWDRMKGNVKDLLDARKLAGGKGQ